MSARRRRSNALSGMKSGKQHEEPTLFLDRCLGRNHFASLLRLAGMKVEVHDNYLPQNAPDDDWIALVGRKGWVAITKDKRIRHREAELKSVKDHKARIIVLRMRIATIEEMANILIMARCQIALLNTKTEARLWLKSTEAASYSSTGQPALRTRMRSAERGSKTVAFRVTNAVTGCYTVRGGGCNMGFGLRSTTATFVYMPHSAVVIQFEKALPCPRGRM